MTPAYHRQYVKFEKQTAYLRGDSSVVKYRNHPNRKKV
jgi:hypothetical protein